MSTLFLAHALAVGSFYGSVRNAVELLDLSTWTWETKTPYPFEEGIFWAPIINVGDKFVIFGGSNDNIIFNKLSRITAYTPHTDEWTTEGKLLSVRSHAGVITIDYDSFLIMGGGTSSSFQFSSSEKCVYIDDQLECTYQSPTEPWGEYF